MEKREIKSVNINNFNINKDIGINQLKIVLLSLLVIIFLIININFISARVHVLEIYAVDENTSINKTVIQTIPLNSGWNLISIPLNFSNNSLENVLISISGKYIEVKDDVKVWNLQLPPAVRLKTIDYKKGYWINMNKSANLTVSGIYPVNCSITLNPSWNLVSFLGKREQNLTDALLSISGKYTEVKDDVKVWNLKLPPAVRLKTMKPNKGYWINMNQSGILVYPDNVCS